MVRIVLPPLLTALRDRLGADWSRGRAACRTTPSPRVFAKSSVEIVGGYVAFLAIVLIFHVWVADDPAAFVSAAGGGAFLWGVVMVAGGWSLIRPRHFRQR